MKPLVDHVRLLSMQGEHPLGLGELSTILLAKEIQASTVLLDDYKARKLAKAHFFSPWINSKTRPTILADVLAVPAW